MSSGEIPTMGTDDPNRPLVLSEVVKKAFGRLAGVNLVEKLATYGIMDQRDIDDVEIILKKLREDPEAIKATRVAFVDCSVVLNDLRKIWCLSPRFTDPAHLEETAKGKLGEYIYKIELFDLLAKEKNLSEPELKLLVGDFTREWLEYQKKWRALGEKSRKGGNYDLMQQ